MEMLSAAELQIIRALLIKKYGPRSPLLDQLARARVAGRRKTGVGIFVNLLIPDDVEKGDELNSEISQSYHTSLAAPCDLVDFTLFIREGCLSFLEGYTFGDVRWPEGPMEDWLVLESPQPSGSA